MPRTTFYAAYRSSSPSGGTPARGALARLCRLLLCAAPALGGCAMSLPMSSLLPPSDDVTGSNSPIPFGRMLDEEDRRRELAALATALDPQGDGSLVKWENAKSGRHGSVIAEGRTYTKDTKVCRGFRGELPGERLHVLRGVACAVSAGEWRVTEAKPTS